ncbi:MAG TPA: hypothetical protein VFW68_02965 [Rhodocyclaceae bacterium]|nr:hypothetical protein [Rhodocyclaceae bacterium]
MQITANSPTSALAIQQGLTGNPSNTDTAETGKSKSKTTSSDTATTDVTTTSATSDFVSLRKLSAADIAALDKKAANDSNSGNGAGSNLVYAEIWKDGVKVGQVYSDGRVQSNGAVTNSDGTAAVSAQLRAQELASQVGGEVRYPGQEAAKANKMRAQLRAAYGV